MSAREFNEAADALRAYDEAARKPYPYTKRPLTDEERERFESEAAEERAERREHDHYMSRREEYL